jgi:hypothetical protein
MGVAAGKNLKQKKRYVGDETKGWEGNAEK